jgi:hypothetical protein
MVPGEGVTSAGLPVYSMVKVRRTLFYKQLVGTEEKVAVENGVAMFEKSLYSIYFMGGQVPDLGGLAVYSPTRCDCVGILTLIASKAVTRTLNGTTIIDSKESNKQNCTSWPGCTGTGVKFTRMNLLHELRR